MKNQRGQSLIEMVVVIGVVVLLAIGIVAGTTASLGSSKDAELRSNAAKYAGDGIELARKLRDDGWNSFAQMGTIETNYCVGDDGVFQPESVCTTPNINDTYTRTVTLALLTEGETNPVEKMSVAVSVSWGDPDDAGNTVNVVTYLTQWR